MRALRPVSPREESPNPVGSMSRSAYSAVLQGFPSTHNVEEALAPLQREKSFSQGSAPLLAKEPLTSISGDALPRDTVRRSEASGASPALPSGWLAVRFPGPGTEATGMGTVFPFEALPSPLNSSLALAGAPLWCSFLGPVTGPNAPALYSKALLWALRMEPTPSRLDQQAEGDGFTSWRNRLKVLERDAVPIPPRIQKDRVADFFPFSHGYAFLAHHRAGAGGRGGGAHLWGSFSQECKRLCLVRPRDSLPPP